jgi:hypothetical protein
MAGAYGNRTYPRKALKTTEIRVPSGAESGALAPQAPTLDAGLASLIDAWPTLPEAIRAGIVAMVRAATEPINAPGLAEP